jgi:tetratricopeptide (TPR) repeat protein
LNVKNLRKIIIGGDMNIRKALFFCFALLLLSALSLSASEILTNESVLKMVQAGLETEIIINKIKTSQSQFNTSVDEILLLKKEGVSGDIINAMMGVPENNRPNQQEDDYQNALNLLQEEKYDEAINILSVLALKLSDIKYHFPLVEALLAKSEIMKDAGDKGWKRVLIDASDRIKGLYGNNTTDADYWLLYAKLLGIRGKDYDARHIEGAFSKVFYYKPGYAKAFLWQGDVYYMLATSMPDDFSERDNAIRLIPSKRKGFGNVAKNAYKTALDTSNLSEMKKSKIYFKLGELEKEVQKNIFGAIDYYKQSVSAHPNGKWAVMAQERLNKYK